MNTAYIGSTELIWKCMFGHIPVDQGGSPVYAWRRYQRKLRDDAALEALNQWVKNGCPK